MKRTNQQKREEAKQLLDFANLLGAPQSTTACDEETLTLTFTVKRDTVRTVCRAIEEAIESRRIGKVQSIGAPTFNSEEFKIIQEYWANTKRPARKIAIERLSKLRHRGLKRAEQYFDQYKNVVKKQAENAYEFARWLDSKSKAT